VSTRGPLPAAAVVLALGRAVLAVPVGYLTVLTTSAWVATLRPADRSPGSATSFAILIPAHDEEAVIGDALAAIERLDYPADRFEVHVVTDHCTDRTVDIVTAAGIDVRENMSGTRGKGPALQWMLTQVLAEADRDGRPLDAVVIVDADTIVAPGFLGAMAARLEAGAVAVQGQYRVRDASASTATALRSAALSLRHHLRPLGRTELGASCGLYGNGMAFAREVLESRGWSDHLTEDIELQNELLLDGVLVAYAPDAVVEAAMPTTLEASRTQNERWERGRIELAKRFVPPLLQIAASDRRRRVAAIDGVLDHVVPPLSVLAASTGGVVVASSALAIVRRGRITRGWWLVGALVVHLLSGLVLSKAPIAVYRSLLHAPGLVVWKLRLWGRMVTRPGAEGWARTPRETAADATPAAP
jgi:cellulose synthase/poly-beta-1,6-N-acetylglucosamine synthase-like glycosyltransferase